MSSLHDCVWLVYAQELSREELDALDLSALAEYERRPGGGGKVKLREDYSGGDDAGMSAAAFFAALEQAAAPTEKSN